MNFVLPSLVNTTEDLSFSNKSQSKSHQNEATQVFPVLASFAAMTLGAACMLCFVGKILSKWYTVDIRVSGPQTNTTDAISERSSQTTSRKGFKATCNVEHEMEMQSIENNLHKEGLVLKYANYNVGYLDIL